jgi:hypothetical protein
LSRPTEDLEAERTALRRSLRYLLAFFNPESPLTAAELRAKTARIEAIEAELKAREVQAP